jgi:phage terminase small subunit
MFDDPTLQETSADETSPESGLTAKQERFCREYLKDLNASAAARRAGYSEHGARGSGCRILAMPGAQAFINAEQELINTKLSTAAKAINSELLDITNLNRSEFLDPDGDIRNPNELPEHLQGAVQVQTKKFKSKGELRTVTTYSLFNKIQMMEKISNRLGKQKVIPEIKRRVSTALMPDGSVKEI